MSGFVASEQALLAAGSRLAQLQAEIQDSFAPLRTDAQSLLDGGWSGGAAEGFARGWQQWLVGFEECLGALDEMGRLLRVTGQGYGLAEGDATNAVTSSGSCLP